jgi:hypothetical protein
MIESMIGALIFGGVGTILIMGGIFLLIYIQLDQDD